MNSYTNTAFVCDKKNMPGLLLLFPTLDRLHGPLARYVAFLVAYVPGITGAFSPPPTSKEAAN